MPFAGRIGVSDFSARHIKFHSYKKKILLESFLDNTEHVTKGLPFLLISIFKNVCGILSRIVHENVRQFHPVAKLKTTITEKLKKYWFYSPSRIYKWYVTSCIPSYMNMADVLPFNSWGFIAIGHCYPSLFFLHRWGKELLTTCKYVFVYRLLLHIDFLLFYLFLVQLWYSIMVALFLLDTQLYGSFLCTSLVVFHPYQLY